MKGYLFDCNAISRWFCENPQIVARVNAVPSDAIFRVSAITLGEIEFGHNITFSTDPARREEFIRWVKEMFPEEAQLPVTRHTGLYYGEIRAKLFRLYPPAGKDENHPEMCFDPVTGKELGIDENDLWIAAQAIEHNLVLVANDKMKRIKDAAGKTLDVEDWEKKPTV